MPAAYVGAAAAVYGAVSQGDAAKSAANQQAQASAASLALQQKMYNTGQIQLAPYLSSGTLAQTKLNTLLGLGGTPGGNQSFADMAAPGLAKLQAVYGDTPEYGGEWQDARTNLYNTLMPQYENQVNSSDPQYGSLLHTFDANDLKNGLAPNYDFMLAQGQGANQNAANLGGGLLGGNALQGLNTFTQNYAQNAYQQAYNNFNTNQSNIYARLSGVAQQGQNSAVQSASNGLTSASQQSGSLANQGAANASGIIGSANAMAGGLNNAASYYQLGQIMNGSGSGSGGYRVAGNGSQMTVDQGSGGGLGSGFDQYLSG